MNAGASWRRAAFIHLLSLYIHVFYGTSDGKRTSRSCNRSKYFIKVCSLRHCSTITKPLCGRIDSYCKKKQFRSQRKLKARSC
ncbi:hypothetical protein EDC01DRAFT_655141 [Geopyxis carbonaria]|nr:hypothetical protein EDC01DRAFT_655141 [Geopyxis carbonaria]